ncbi:hypothetical protein A3D78_01760, partial [Candidatus Gottesmanbacteria bacterium RIFCSPHIGHO2_02_FULL_39_14]
SNGRTADSESAYFGSNPNWAAKNMIERFPKICISILVIKDKKFLLGLLTKKWEYLGKQVYGVPGRDIKFREKIGDAIKRNIKDEIGCAVIKYKIIAVNANYAFDNHFIGIGVTAKIEGTPKLLKPGDWEKWEWFDMNKIPKNLFPDAENVITCYKKKKFIVAE